MQNIFLRKGNFPKEPGYYFLFDEMGGDDEQLVQVCDTLGFLWVWGKESILISLRPDLYWSDKLNLIITKPSLSLLEKS